jgi:hypothetical protein
VADQLHRHFHVDADNNYGDCNSGCDSQAIQHVAAVIRRMQNDPQSIMMQDIGTDTFRGGNQHRRNQEWARKQEKTIARFVRTRKLTSELQDRPTRTKCAAQPPRGIGRPEVTSAAGLRVEAVITKPATRTVGDLLEALQIASHNNQTAFLVVGFEETTKFICGAASCECDLYEMLARQLDEGGDVVGMITLTLEKENGDECVQADAWLVREHMGQEWARRYLNAVGSSFVVPEIVAATVGTRAFLEAN